MSEREAVLFVNEAFYQAFQSRDYDALEILWSRREDISCLHPGWKPVYGRDAVLQSWLAILANPASPPIICMNSVARIIGDAAYVTCYEDVQGDYLIATNIFAREEGPNGKVWRLVHHQSGPTAGMPEPEADKRGPVN